MSIKRICVLSCDEGEALKRGDHVSCSNHYHVKEREADGMLYAKQDSYEPMAKYAIQPNGRISRRHIIQIREFRWRVVARRSPLGGIGMSGWQLLPTKA